MKLDLAVLFPALAVATWLGVPLYAALARGRFYAIFSAVLLSVALPGALVLHSRLRAALPAEWVFAIDAVFAWSMLVSGLQFAHLVRARMRSSAFRWLVSVPGQTFIAAGMLAGPWLIVFVPFRMLCEALDWTNALAALTFVEAMPLAVALASVSTSTAARPETVRIRLAREGPKAFARVSVERIRGAVAEHDSLASAARSARDPSRPTNPRDRGRPLRVVQLTDTHLGPWQSVSRLRRRVASLVERNPDLIALTGDYLTMESMGSPGCLAHGLAPLAPVANRCVAIFGNHDHEAPEHVRDALTELGITLLVDGEACFETAAGAVQVIGSDYLSQDHAKRLAALLERHPRREGHLRRRVLRAGCRHGRARKNGVALVDDGNQQSTLARRLSERRLDKRRDDERQRE